MIVSDKGEVRLDRLGLGLGWRAGLAIPSPSGWPCGCEYVSPYLEAVPVTSLGYAK